MIITHGQRKNRTLIRQIELISMILGEITKISRIR
jgi:hypothetical protein